MSLFLVVIQLALVVLQVLPYPVVLPLSATTLVTLSAGAFLCGWTLFFNRIGNFNIRPEPKENGRLVTSGPYRFVRHPMYTAVLLLMAAFVSVDDEPLKIVYWVLLLVVLWIKSSVEEKMLIRKFPDYADYMHKTGRFLPRLFQ